MVAIRSALYFVAMVLTVCFFGLAMATVGWLFPVAVRHGLANSWGRSNLWLMRVICGLDYRIHGAENLPQGAAIVMSKHQSTWETISLRGLIRKEQSWILKRELMWIPIFGWALASVPTIPIDRKAGRKALKVISELGVQRLRDNLTVIVFPEGTRTAPGEHHKYGIGGGMLAEKAGPQYPVIPIAHNAGVFWRRRGLNKFPGVIDVVVGEPIPTEGKKAAEITREIEAWIEGEMSKLPGSLEEYSRRESSAQAS